MTALEAAESAERIALRHRLGWECGPECPLCPSRVELFVTAQLMRTNPDLALAMIKNKRYE